MVDVDDDRDKGMLYSSVEILEEKKEKEHNTHKMKEMM
jgi:hypothetical protein